MAAIAALALTAQGKAMADRSPVPRARMPTAAKMRREALEGAGAKPSLSVEEGASSPPVVAWLRLAIGSLALAGVFAVLVAVARTPGVQDLVGPDYFRTSLVGHVTFSLNIWLLSFMAALWALVTARLGLRCEGGLAQGALWLAVAGVGLMAGASIAGVGRPSLVDYLPILEHPVFLAGLAAFFAGVALAAISFIAGMARLREPLPLEAKALGIAAVVYLAAIITLLVVIGAGLGRDLAALTWGPGHLLQVVNAAGLIAAWSLLLPVVLPKGAQALLGAALLLLLLPAAVVPLLYLTSSPVALGAMGTLTWVAVAVPTVGAWLAVGSRCVGERSRCPGSAPLRLSLLLFAAGILVAFLGLESDTKVTAHYHGTVGAVTMAYMGLTYRWLPVLCANWRKAKWASLQPSLYGGGLLLLIAGLFWAGGMGASRKVFAAFSPEPTVLGPVGLVGLGALVAVVGGAVFVLQVGTLLLGEIRSRETPPALETDGKKLGPGYGG